MEKRLLGLDVGTKTIGIAVSDPLGLTAQGVEVWRRRDEERDIAHLREVCQAYGVDALVVGLPLRTDGSKGPEAAEVEAFGRRLADTLGLPVIFWDERFTTQIAQRAMLEAGMRRKRRRELVDMTAAALILQGYLERRGRNERT